MSDEELIARLRDLGFNLTDAAADRIEALSKERVELNDRIIAMETGDWSEVRLVRFENGQFDLTAGPIPAIAEYLAQMMEDGNGEYFNFMEMQINHKSAGPMVLSLQRKNGRTPNELRKEAEAKLAKAVEALEGVKDYVDDASRGRLLYRGKTEISEMAGEDLIFIQTTLAEIKSGVATTPYGLKGERHE